MSYKLTIAIPTYNRPESLIKTLVLLLPQLNDNCKLLIIDNNSSIIVADKVKLLLADYPKVKCDIVRNKVNIGANANIMRCFELCQTQWLWTLSDDDIVSEKSIDIIFNSMQEYPDAVNINFYSPHELHPVRDSLKVYFGKNGLIDSIDYWGAMIFISTNIYNMSKINLLDDAFNSVYSCSSQWLILYYSISNNNYIVRSNKIIVENGFNQNLIEDKFSNNDLKIVSGFMILFDLFLDKANRNILTKKIVNVSKSWFTFERIIKILIVDYFRSNKEIDILFHLKRYYYRFYKFRFGKNTFLFYFILLSLSISKSMTFEIICTYAKLKNGNDLKKYIPNFDKSKNTKM